MGTTYLGNAEGNAWLQEHLTDRICWLACNISEPNPVYDPASEVIGGGYIRKRIIFGPPSVKTVANTNNIIIPNMPEVSVRWVSVHSDQFAGRLIIASHLDSLEFVPFGGEWLAAPGDLAFQL